MPGNKKHRDISGSKKYSSNNSDPVDVDKDTTLTRNLELEHLQQETKAEQAGIAKRLGRSDGLRLRSGKMVPHLSDDDTIDLLGRTQHYSVEATDDDFTLLLPQVTRKNGRKSSRKVSTFVIF